MKIFHKIDQETCNELHEQVGLTAMCYYNGAVDLLNGGFIDAAFQQLCNTKFACFRANAPVPSGVCDLEEAIVRAKVGGWTGAPEHWRHADLAFSDMRKEVFSKAISELDEMVNTLRRSPLRAVSIETLSSLEKQLAYVREIIEPAINRDREIAELRKTQEALNPCNFSQLPQAPAFGHIHPPMGSTLRGTVELQYDNDKQPVRAELEVSVEQ